MCVYLSQCELHPSQVVVIAKVRGGVVDIVDPQLEILNRLKVIIHFETLTKRRTGGVLHTLRTSQLAERGWGVFDLSHRKL